MGIFGGVAVAIAVIWIAYFARADWRKTHHPCICSHGRDRHVSAWDYDSDFGDPQHVGPDYRIPGTCRDCRCRAYIAH